MPGLPDTSGRLLFARVGAVVNRALGFGEALQEETTKRGACGENGS